MSEFVNYNKRKITLPPGCKDLMDVLKPRSRRDIESMLADAGMGSTVTSNKFTGSLQDVAEYLKQGFDSKASTFSLNISSLDECITVNFSRMRDVGTFASVEFQEDEATEKAARDFFTRSGLNAPDESGPGSYVPVFPNLPVYNDYRISPLPADVSLLSKLVKDLFREVAGLNEDAALRFLVVEVSDAA